MRRLVLPLCICLASSFCLGQSPADDPARTLQERSIQAQALHDKHAYAEAASILEKLSSDPQVTALPDWPNQLYNLACDQALERKPAQAILTLQQAVNLGTTLSVDQVREDPDLATLRDDSGFKQLVSRMERQGAFWRDDSAIASPYKPALTEDEKVAGLSKFWSEARFSFPFFGRLPEMDWDRVYMEYLPQVRAAKTTKDYYLVLMRFAAQLHDGHTVVYAPDELDDELLAFPTLRTQLVENKVLITEVSDQTLAAAGIRVGDEIVSIDGMPVRQYAEQNIAPFVNASTDQDRNVRVYDYELLFGPLASSVRLLLKNANGRTEAFMVPRKKFDINRFRGEPLAFKMLPGGVAYLAINEFVDDAGANAIRANFRSIKQAKGLILDLRKNGGGNDSNGFAILSMLADKPFLTERWRALDYKPAYLAWGSLPTWDRGTSPPTKPDTAYHLSMPVVVLIGPQTYSAAEDFVAAFEAMHRGTLVGEPTGGSTGQPLSFKLPGDGVGQICTVDVSGPSGLVFEGVGIHPQIEVSPSISDIREAKDAALERAIQTLEQSSQR